MRKYQILCINYNVIWHLNRNLLNYTIKEYQTISGLYNNDQNNLHKIIYKFI